ncbi:hypothetical protein [Micromonospora chokoriensis]
MSDATKVIAKVTFFYAADGEVETCYQAGQAYNTTDPGVKANRQFFKADEKPQAAKPVKATRTPRKAV